MYHNLLSAALLLLLIQNARSLLPAASLLTQYSSHQSQIRQIVAAGAQTHLFHGYTGSLSSTLLLTLDSYDSEGVPPSLLAFTLIAVVATIAVPQLSRTIVIKSNTRSLTEEDKLNPPPNPYE